MDSFLDLSFLRTLDTIRVLARQGIKGSSAGIHRSVTSGSSLEFMDYRKYQTGDDIRYVDWNIYGRTNRLFLKVFHAEKEITRHIIVDMSLSMKAGHPGKSIFAKKIVAALSYIGLANQDHVGITSFARHLGSVKSPERGKDVYLSVLKYLNQLKPSGQTGFNRSMTAFASAKNKPGIAIVVSDLLDPGGYEEGLNALLLSKFKVSLIQVLEDEELNPSFKGSFLLREMETGSGRRLSTDQNMLETYQKKMTDYINGIETFCKKRGMDYHLANTSDTFEDFFLRYLQTGYPV